MLALVPIAYTAWPWEIHAPLIWPALLGTVFLAWTQVLTWMTYGLPGLRILVMVLWLHQFASAGGAPTRRAW